MNDPLRKLKPAELVSHYLNHVYAMKTDPKTVVAALTDRNGELFQFYEVLLAARVHYGLTTHESLPEKAYIGDLVIIPEGDHAKAYVWLGDRWVGNIKAAYKEKL